MFSLLRKFRKQAHGFTLAELLISLAILGVIATFTIPKILSTQQDEKRRSVFRETYAALSQTLYTGIVLKGEITDIDSYWTYLQNHLNAVKFCVDASAEGCWSGSSDNVFNSPVSRGILLHNGAMITDFDPANTLGTGDNVWIDWNGTAGPNLHCDDQIPIVYFLTTTVRGGISGQIGQIKYRIDPPGTPNKSCPASVYDAL